MKKSVIAFGIVFSLVATSLSASNGPDRPILKKDLKIVKTTIKDLTPLSIAVVKGNFDTTKKFLEFGSDINQKSGVMGMTPLMYAARYNNVELMKLLVSNGADVKAKSKIGATALKYAKAANAHAAVKYLKSL
ncbi:ankyrin repeat domain-containing protein [Cellulophaga omnivescoria]|uniref:ankyrin repeat domain-containing protein n=1 Tax=Cellulophaga omnivescoria TaxID=1888890 RepID=UPI0009849B89|nr:ankyrin repeat domain-containing protein [Cellulophaga omnivescoria]WBU90019.1 ankyrin repeat domain-containing protein [Cellulophaga omnivescoria]WKB82143.1 ankyrin repeat domain-containing protein [Cellulophaga lytica]